MNPTLKLAEYILPGHPDKLCDAIADGLVDFAVSLDPEALVGIEVSIYRSRIFIDGRIAASGRLTGPFAEAVAKQVYADAGYGGVWGPDPDKLEVIADLCLGPLSKEERPLRRYSDDQCICVGYACGDETTNFLPVEQFLAWKLAKRLSALRADRPDLGTGPDGKVIIAAEQSAGEFRVRSVSFSVQHEQSIDWVALCRAARELAVTTLASAALDCPQIVFDEKDLRIVVNGGGQFTIGGPAGDNGLSGKKLVVDAWGPCAPIGGGALSGKDPHKVDRAGTLRARQVAREIVATGMADEAQVTLAFYPGDEAPSHFGILADGCPLPARAVERWRSRHDLSLARTNAELGLDAVKWQPLAIWGHFTNPALPWEGGAGC